MVADYFYTPNEKFTRQQKPPGLGRFLGAFHPCFKHQAQLISKLSKNTKNSSC